MTDEEFKVLISDAYLKGKTDQRQIDDDRLIAVISEAATLITCQTPTPTAYERGILAGLRLAAGATSPRRALPDALESADVIRFPSIERAIKSS